MGTLIAGAYDLVVHHRIFLEVLVDHPEDQTDERHDGEVPDDSLDLLLDGGWTGDRGDGPVYVFLEERLVVGYLVALGGGGGVRLFHHLRHDVGYAEGVVIHRVDWVVHGLAEGSGLRVDAV